LSAITAFATRPQQDNPRPLEKPSKPEKTVVTSHHSLRRSSHLEHSPTRSHPKISRAIDLTPQPIGAERSALKMTDDEWSQLFTRMLEQGWPEDVVNQMRADRKEGVIRVYGVTFGDAARYLGVSRHALTKLIDSGKLRVSTITPLYRGQKPEKRIPAKDILGPC
jgi:hypothetical protein